MMLFSTNMFSLFLNMSLLIPPHPVLFLYLRPFLILIPLFYLPPLLLLPPLRLLRVTLHPPLLIKLLPVLPLLTLLLLFVVVLGLMFLHHDSWITLCKSPLFLLLQSLAIILKPAKFHSGLKLCRVSFPLLKKILLGSLPLCLPGKLQLEANGFSKSSINPMGLWIDRKPGCCQRLHSS